MPTLITKVIFNVSPNLSCLTILDALDTGWIIMIGRIILI